MTAVYNFTVSDGFIAGEDQPFSILVTDADTSLPLNMGGYTLAFTIAQRDGDTPLVTIPNGSITVGNGSGTNDKATFTILAATSVTLAAGRYRYALWRTDTGSKEVLMLGDIPVLSAVAAS